MRPPTIAVGFTVLLAACGGDDAAGSSASASGSASETESDSQASDSMSATASGSATDSDSDSAGTAGGSGTSETMTATASASGTATDSGTDSGTAGDTDPGSGSASESESATGPGSSSGTGTGGGTGMTSATGGTTGGVTVTAGGSTGFGGSTGGDMCMGGQLGGDIVVDVFTDTTNANECSLRSAVQAAETDAAVDGCAAGSGADTIYLPAGLYTLTPPINFPATTDIKLLGDGMGCTIIDAGDNLIWRYFNHADDDGVLRFEDLTVQNAVLTETYADVFMTRVEGTGAPLPFVEAREGTLTVVDSYFHDNADASLRGEFEDMVVERCTFRDNSGSSITNSGANTSLTVTGTTFEGHKSTSGRAIETYATDLRVVNSTFSGNEGGSIWSTFGPVELAHVTFVDNTSPDAAGVIGGGPDLSMVNCLIVDSEDSEGNVCKLLAGSVVVERNNVFDVATGCEDLTQHGTDVVNVAVSTSSLADNGGPTETHAIDGNSAAAGAGACNDASGAAITTDQRGFTRDDNLCSSGAYEPNTK